MKKKLAALSVLLLMSGCAGAVDMDKVVCEELANYVRDGQPLADRERVVQRSLAAEDADLRARVVILQDNLDSPPLAWETAFEGVAYRCLALNKERRWR